MTTLYIQKMNKLLNKGMQCIIQGKSDHHKYNLIGTYLIGAKATSSPIICVIKEDPEEK